MFVHRSNRTEQLATSLAEMVRRPLADPLTPEWIAVQGQGIERWLSMQLARSLGVWANPEFPFPRRLLELLIDGAAAATAFGQHHAAAPASPFAPEVLRWSIAAVLPSLLATATFEPVRRYLADDAAGLRAGEFGERVARLFDQYIVYRPQMIALWENGGDNDWQADLWRALVARHGRDHFAHRARSFLHALRNHAVPHHRLPPRIALFGISALPPLYLEMLAAVAQHIEVHLFLLSPTREFWGDTRSLREQARLRRTTPTAAFDEGHPLLASLGRVGREFHESIEEFGGEYQAHDAYVEPGGATMLAQIQSDILHLRSPHGEAKLACSPGDDSIQVHACHSPMREVEVLHDLLAECFRVDASLQPTDIIVMSPSIDTYAPLIDAVFSGGDGPRLPYRVADRAVASTDDAVHGFLTALAVIAGRMSAPEVIDLLEFEPLRARFGLEREDCDAVRQWIDTAAIRWGVDAAHREAAGQPADGGNTWRFGLDRLLLGYAFGAAESRTFAGVAPCDGIEGTTAETLGQFVDFCTVLFEARAGVAEARPLAAWRADLTDLLARLLREDNRTSFQHQSIRKALGDLAEQAELAGFDDAVSFDALRGLLGDALESAAPGRNFLGGGITFSAMMPMRSVPFRVVCLLGVSDGSFPRAHRPMSFDRMAQQPRPGDRSAREDDRYLFLEALLAARDRLVITYVGQSIRDNAALPPSVVVSELLDAVAQRFAEADDQPAAHRLTVRHPLQPFSPRYFDRDPSLFSYSEVFLEGARALIGRRRSPAPLLTTPLARPAAADREIALTQFIRFFQLPVRAFAQRRLALRLRERDDLLDDREPIELDALERYAIGDEVVATALADRTPREPLRTWMARGKLPLGNLGALAYESIETDAGLLADTVRAFVQGRQRPPLEIDLDIAGTHLFGELRQLWPEFQVFHHHAELRGHHRLAAWIAHLVLQLTRRPEDPERTALIGRRKSKPPTACVFLPVSDAEAELAALIDLYGRGQCEPLALFRHASVAFVEGLGGGEQAALDAAVKTFGERDQLDAYVARFFPEPEALALRNPRGTGFGELAVRVYQPLLEHSR